VTLRGPSNLAGIARQASVAAGVVGVLLAAMTLWRRGFNADDPVVTTIGQTLLACFFGAVLVLALRLPSQMPLVRMFSSSSLRFFGRYSYGLYVFHHPILFLKPGLLPLDWIPVFEGSMLLKLGVYIMSATAVSLVLALISWHLYEKQFLRLKRFFPYHSGEIQGSSSRSSAAAASLLADSVDQ
jgi:peptidoglycan/LPS O-acetylase OafA/YrhL